MSAPAEMRKLPVLLNATAVTALTWPVPTARHDALSLGTFETSHSRTVLSLLPDASRCVLARLTQSSERTASVCPASVSRHPSVLLSYT